MTVNCKKGEKMKTGEKSAKNFIALLEKGVIRKNILPNTSKDYSKYQEEDLFYYKLFLHSFAYDDIKECKTGDYYGE